MFIKICVYRQPYSLPERLDYSRRDSDDVRDFVAAATSIARSKSLITDIVLCNPFDLFCTFTFDPKKYDRTDMAHLKGVVCRWLENQRRFRSEGLKYLLVPEYHKDGKSVHFHALLYGFEGTLNPSKHKQNGRMVYNLTGYRAGFSTAVRIDNIEAVSRYMTKYITKDMPMLFNKRRFMVSQGLVRPKKRKNVLFSRIPALFKKQVYSDDSCEIYNIPHGVRVD